ncbi:MAG TPA: ABC transporter permease [Candidatus Lokiarchaeia archaeon]|nr:ABC transporter permease [Candidatus Lokiarchaeia archaeon]
MASSLTFVSLSWTGIFVGLIIFVSLAKDFRIIKETVSAVIKMLVQLFIMGYVLMAIIYIQTVNDPLSQLFMWAIIAVMLLNAIVTTSQRGKGIPHIRGITALGILAGTFLVLLLLIIAGVAEYSVIGLIPFVGSIVGNTLTKNSQGLERIIAEFQARLPEMETILALGGTIKQATANAERKTMQSIFIPMNDSMRNAGFFLPGAAVGLIITGTPPVEAMIFQCIMFLSWMGGTIISATIVNTLATKQMVNNRTHQINYDVVRSFSPPLHDHDHHDFERHRNHDRHSMNA